MGRKAREGSSPSARTIFSCVSHRETAGQMNAGLKAARRRGRVGGRPKALDEADLKQARALLRSGEYSKVQVADELEVSRHTLWRAL